MKAQNLFYKSILLLVASTTPTLFWQNQSQAQLREVISQAREVACRFLCNKPTQFGGSQTTPGSPSTPVNNTSKRILIDNQTGRKLLVQIALHINGTIQPMPQKNSVWVVEQNQKVSLIEIDGKKNKITDSDIWLNISNEKGKLWDKNKKYFITPEDDRAAVYFIEPLGNKPDFTYTIVEKIPPSQPWVFPIFP